MTLCYFCNNVADHECTSCNLPICDIHTVLLEKQTPSGGTESGYYCPSCCD
ncbi:MAG: hypothetical protein ACTSRG_17025 [Candidatus Helarchaeota archaeon]